MPVMSGARVVAEMLAGYGITHVFMVPAILRRSMVEMEQRTSISRIHAHGEKAAAYMADGYARAGRRPGVCMAQLVGALNLAAGLRDAWLGHSPVLAFTGGTSPETEFRQRYQEVNDLPSFGTVTKFSGRVDAVDRFPDMIRQAFRVATSGCPGPVHLQCRGQEGEIDADEADMEALVESDFAYLPPLRPEPEASRVLAAATCIGRAKRPVIVAGGGVRASDAGSALVSAAEKLQIPVATSLNGKDSIPGNHPLAVGVVGTYCRGSANQVVSGADLVVFVGTETGSMTTHFWQVPLVGTPAIQVDINPEALGRNYPLEVAILGDARVTLEKLGQAMEGKSLSDQSAWMSNARAKVAAWEAGDGSFRDSDQVPIRPERICKELSRTLPSDAIVIADTGHAGMWMGGMFDLTAPTQSFIRSAGHLGWAFPAGLGAKCANPSRPVVTFTGDAGILYHLAEIETAARWKINAVTVVNNNSAGNQSKPGFDRAYGGRQTEQGRRLWTFNDLNYARIAENLGALGIRIERPSELPGAIEQALAADRPVLIDVVTDIDAIAPTAPAV